METFKWIRRINTPFHLFYCFSEKYWKTLTLELCSSMWETCGTSLKGRLPHDFIYFSLFGHSTTSYQEQVHHKQPSSFSAECLYLTPEQDRLYKGHSICPQGLQRKTPVHQGLGNERTLS